MSHPQQQPQILLLGTGSIGSVYLYQFQRAGCKVTAVCRSNYQAVKQDGFTLHSQRFGDVHFHPDHVVRSTDECLAEKDYDFIFVATKAFPEGSTGSTTPSLKEMLQPVIHNPHTAIVLAQNGIAIEDEIAAAFPANPLLSCVVYLPATQTQPGVIEYPEMLNLLEIGTFPAQAPTTHKQAAIHLADLVVAGGGEAAVHEDIQTARWGKLLMNAAWNPIGALTLTSDGGFLASSSYSSSSSSSSASGLDEYALELVWSLMKEIITLAQAMGVQGVDERVAQQKLSIAKRRAATGQGREVSMLQDVRQGRLFEVEAIVGNTVRLGRLRGVKMPLMEAIYALAKARFDALVRELDRDRDAGI